MALEMKIQFLFHKQFNTEILNFLYYSLKLVPHVFQNSHRNFRIPSGLSNVTFSQRKLHKFIFTPTGDTYPHRLILLNYIPHRTAVDQLQLFIVHIPAQSYQSTLHFHISLSHSTVL